MNETTEDFAAIGKDILEESIEVSMNEGDLRKIFGSVLAANIVAYSVIVGIKTIVKRVSKKRKKARKKKDKENKEI